MSKSKKEIFTHITVHLNEEERYYLFRGDVRENYKSWCEQAGFWCDRDAYGNYVSISPSETPLVELKVKEYEVIYK